MYQYADIWGNVKLTYTDSNNNGIIEPATEIMREQNYYPFGLEHKGYNGNVIGAKNNKKQYQGQEYTEDLDLNVHEWKYRISDPAIGRFWQIDPLAEDYVYNSTYAFQENKMGMGIELEGLEMIPFPVRSIGDGIAQSFNSTTGSVNRSVNRTINSAQSFVVENKETILGVASSIQKTGDMATTVGLVSAAAGSMVAGVGAAPGSALAVAGGIVEGIGNVLEIVTNAITENYGDSASKIAVEVVGEVTGSVIDKVIPGPNPDFSKPVKDLITNTSEALNHLTKNKVKEVVQPVIKKSIDILEE